MKTTYIILFFLFLLFSAQKSFSQSDDGWFTGKISGGYKFAAVDYIYNLENHFSFGTGAGILSDERKKCFFTGDLRIRPFGKKLVMPAFWLSYGYLTKEKCGIFLPKISVELGNLAPVRFATDLGCGFFGGKKSVVIGAAVEF